MLFYTNINIFPHSGKEYCLITLRNEAENRGFGTVTGLAGREMMIIIQKGAAEICGTEKSVLPLACRNLPDGRVIDFSEYFEYNEKL